MSSVFSKDPLRPKGEVLSYVPKNLDARKTGVARGFIEDGTLKNQDFQIDPMISEQSGVAEIKRQQIRDEIDQKVQLKFEAVKEDARQEGFAEGVQQGIREVFRANEAQIIEQIEKIQMIANQFDNLKMEVLAQSEDQIVRLVYHLATQLAGKEIQASSEGILHLLQNTLSTIQNDEKIKIYINPDDLSFLDTVSESTNRIPNFKNVSFVADKSITRGGAKIESNFSEIDATIETRSKRTWDQLAKSLPDLSSQNLNLKTDNDGSGEDDKS